VQCDAKLAQKLVQTANSLSQKKQQDQYADIMKRVENLNINDKNRSLNKIGQLENDIKRLKASVFKDLSLSYLYSVIGNSAKSEAIIRKLLNQFYTIKNLHPYHSYGFDMKRLESYLYLILSKMNDDNRSKSLIRVLLRHLSSDSKFKYPFEINSRYELLLTRQNIKDKLSSVHYAKLYPALWYPLIEDLMTSSEAIDFLHDSHLIWKKYIVENAWLFYYVIPKEEKERKKLFRTLEKQFQSKNLVDRDLKLFLLSNDAFKRFYEKYTETKLKPLFVQKRNYYKDLLKNKSGVEYAIYNLLLIGDQNNQYIDILNE
jgi:hypothetical protein